MDAVEGLPVRAVEFSSLVPPARRAMHLAEFRSGRAQVSVSPDISVGTSSPKNTCTDLCKAGGQSALIEEPVTQQPAASKPRPPAHLDGLQVPTNTTASWVSQRVTRCCPMLFDGCAHPQSSFA